MISRFEHTRVIRRDSEVLVLQTATGARQLDPRIWLGMQPSFIREGQLLTLSYSPLPSGAEEMRISAVVDVTPDEERTATHLAQLVEEAGLGHVRGPHALTVGLDAPKPVGPFDLHVVAALLEIAVPGARAFCPWYLKDGIELSFAPRPGKEAAGGSL